MMSNHGLFNIKHSIIKQFKIHQELRTHTL